MNIKEEVLTEASSSHIKKRKTNAKPSWGGIIPSNSIGCGLSSNTAGLQSGGSGGQQPGHETGMCHWGNNTSHQQVFVGKNVVSGPKEMIFPFCLAPIRLHLECSVLFCSLENEKLERVQQKATKMYMGLEYMIYTHIYDLYRYT